MFYLGGHVRHNNIGASNRGEIKKKKERKNAVQHPLLWHFKTQKTCFVSKLRPRVSSGEHRRTDRRLPDRWRASPQRWGLNIPSLRLWTPVTVEADSSQADVWNVFGAHSSRGRPDVLPHGSQPQSFPTCRTKCVCRTGRRRRIRASQVNISGLPSNHLRSITSYKFHASA